MSEEQRTEKMRVLKSFIEKEIANSDDKYALDVATMQKVFEDAIKAVEEVTGETIDLGEFNKFIKLYKVMKIAEKVAEDLRIEAYVADMKLPKKGLFTK